MCTIHFFDCGEGEDLCCVFLTDLRRKEVISSKTGHRIGFVDDIELDTKTAKLISIVIFGRARCFGLFGKDENVVIKWENICLIGEDTILVNYFPAPKVHFKWKIPIKKLIGKI